MEQRRTDVLLQIQAARASRAWYNHIFKQLIGR